MDRVGQRRLKSGERAALLTAASNGCYNPECSEPLVVARNGHNTVNFEIAHIRDELPPATKEADLGWRYWPDDLTQDQRNRYDNLILLCSPCHTVIDTTEPRSYSVELLHDWKRFAEGRAQRELAAAVDGFSLQDLLSLLTAEFLALPLVVPEPAPDAGMLAFTSGLLPYVGMAETTDALRRFLDSEERFSWWLLTGKAGIGKSRLALELCFASESAWRAGFLRESDQQQLLLHRPVEPTLVVVDYAAARAEWLGSALLRHAESEGEYSAPLRILILERGLDGLWFDQAVRRHRHHESVAILARQYDTPMALAGLSDEALRELASRIAASLSRSDLSGSELEDIVDRTRAMDPAGRPLLAIVAALDALEGRAESGTRDSMLRELLGRRRAQRDGTGMTAEERSAIVAVELLATCVGGLEALEYASFREDHPRLAGQELPAVGSLHSLSVAGVLDGVLPDIMGELAVLDAIGKGDAIDYVTGCCVEAASAFSAERHQAFVGRTAQDHPWHPNLPRLLPNHQTATSLSVWLDLVPSLVKHLGSTANPNIDALRAWVIAAAEGSVVGHEAPAVFEFNVATLHLMGDHQPEAAQRILSDVLATVAQTSELRFQALTNRGVAWSFLGQHKNAEDDYTTVIDSEHASDESRACCFNNRADLHVDAGDLEASIKDRTAVLQLAETTYNRRYIALGRRARALWELGDHAGAFADIRSILDTPDIAVEQKMASLIDRAHWYAAIGEMEKARTDASSVLSSRRNWAAIATEASALARRLESTASELAP